MFDQFLNLDDAVRVSKIKQKNDLLKSEVREITFLTTKKCLLLLKQFRNIHIRKKCSNESRSII